MQRKQKPVSSLHQPHDSFFKRLLSAFLENFGSPHLNYEVRDAARFVDVFFERDPIVWARTGARAGDTRDHQLASNGSSARGGVEAGRRLEDNGN